MCYNIFYALLVVVISSICGLSQGQYFVSAPINASRIRPPSPSLEKLVKLDPKSYSLWKISKKYNFYNPENVTLTCISEIVRDPKVCVAYMINLTLEKNIEFLEKYSAIEYDIHGPVDIITAPGRHRKRSYILADQEKYFSILKEVQDDNIGDDGVFCSSIYRCGCFSKSISEEYERELINFTENTKLFFELIICGNYIDPILRLFIGIPGLIMNITFVIIFLKEKSTRKVSNVLIINLVINNIFMLILYLPTNFMLLYIVSNPFVENIYLGIQIFVISANTLNIFLLNVQRHVEVQGMVYQNSINKTTLLRIGIIYSSILWGWSLGISLILIISSPEDAYTLETILYSLIYLLIFSLVLAILGAITSKKLERAGENGNRSEEFENITPANVVLFLTIGFYVTHVPYFLYRLHELIVVEMRLDYFYDFVFKISHYIIYFIFFSYPFVNVIILYKTSRIFKPFFRKYLFRRWINSDERDLTDVPLQNYNAPRE